jgi:hypothetical protein
MADDLDGDGEQPEWNDEATVSGDEEEAIADPGCIRDFISRWMVIGRSWGSGRSSSLQ